MKKILITTLIVVFLAVATSASATFIDNGDGTVTDDVTGLMWIQNDDSTPQGKDAACAYCASLAEQEFAGYNDWRAPTIEELQTIIDYRYNSPAIDGSVFDADTIGDYYWSSTTLPSISSFAWFTTTSSGVVDNYFSDYFDANIRCVRGDAFETTFVANGDDETVTDSNGLVWTKHTSGTSMSWEEANAYCNNLEAGGMSDWFLPAVEELRTVVAFDEAGPAVDTSLFEVEGGTEAYYWTATDQAGLTGNAWRINFSNGYTAPADKTSAGWVRCAREAAPENYCECQECPVCEPEIIEVPVEKIVYVDAPCACEECDLSGLTTYKELKAKHAELTKTINKLKKCRFDATRAMYKAREAERKALIAKKKAEYLAKLKAHQDKNK
jgi:hypothetical protein